jgi:signal transduction histidine kinase/ActR/RegA family two-component response regulator
MRSMEPADDDPERERAAALAARARVLAEQVGYVHDQGVAGAFAMLIVALLYAGVLWRVTDHRHLLLWLAALLAACGARLGFALYWRRRGACHGTVFWTRAAMLVNLLAGAVWGYAAVALFPLQHPDLYIVAAFVLVGMPAAALTSLSAWSPAYAAYALAAVAPFVVWVFSLRQPQFAVVGLAGLTFCAYLLRQGHLASAMIRRNILQRIELEQMSADLARARDAAQAASRAKSVFLANLSHELRTPLNAVVGLSDLLVEHTGGPRGRELAATMRQSALSLLGLLEQVLDLGRIETGTVELRPRSFDVRALMRDVHAMFRPEAQRRGLTLRVDVDGAAPSQATADADRIRQVLVNLIDNALKFTAAGSVSVSVSFAAHGEGRHRLRFEVADTGTGVDAAVRARISAVLAQPGAAAPMARGHTGLGLSICATLVRLLDGEIGFRSETARGATFWFTCAVGIAPPPRREIMVGAPTSTQRGAPRVLVVEDNGTNLMLTRTMLEAFGCDVRGAPSGADGLRCMQHEEFDLVLMDVSMPGMDGIETTRVWRAHERSGEQRLPIVALTANAMAGDRQACLAAGMDDYLAKPFTLEALRRMVARHVPGMSA